MPKWHDDTLYHLERLQVDVKAMTSNSSLLQLWTVVYKPSFLGSFTMQLASHLIVYASRHAHT